MYRYSVSTLSRSVGRRVLVSMNRPVLNKSLLNRPLSTSSASANALTTWPDQSHHSLSTIVEQVAPSSDLLKTLLGKLAQAIPQSAYHHLSTASISMRYFSSPHHQLYTIVDLHQCALRRYIDQLSVSSVRSELLMQDTQFMFAIEKCVRAVAQLYPENDYRREGRFHDILYGWDEGVHSVARLEGLLFTLNAVVARIEKIKELVNEELWLSLLRR